MELIEVNIKLASNNQVYNLPIRKSETILKLKEYCQIISNIPKDQQKLLCKGKMLLNEKLIKDYDIENNQEIILVKNEEQKAVNINQFSDNKGIDPKRIAKAIGNLPDLLSFFQKVDFAKLDNYLKLMKIANSPGISNTKNQELREYLKDPRTRYLLKNINKNGSLAKLIFSDPSVQKDIQETPILKLWFQNPEIYLTPQNLKKIQNMFEFDEKNIDCSNSEISVPPDPFGSLNSNQNSQIMNSSKNKKIFRNNEIDIDFKKEYKEQMSQLKDMGFTNEEINIQALLCFDGDIEKTIEGLLRLKNMDRIE